MENAMKVTFGLKQGLISGGVFVILLFALVSVDARVQDRFHELVAGQSSVSSFGDRAGQLGDALLTAVKYQSIENAPMVVFATVGAVLFLFMVRT
jgi:hypothetical protein